MKTLVYRLPINTRDELIARIEEAAAVIRGKPASLLRSVTDAWLRRAQLCVDHHGDNFEQFL